jgi:hypothetical protein
MTLLTAEMREKTLPKSWLKNLKGWDFFGGLSVNGRILLKRSTNVIRGCELDSCDSGPRPLAECAQDIEPSGSLRASNILTSLAGIGFLITLSHNSLRNTFYEQNSLISCLNQALLNTTLFLYTQSNKRPWPVLLYYQQMCPGTENIN